jgi:hypothetical protein
VHRATGVVCLHFALRSTTISLYPMSNTSLLRCDGCGQPASAEHIARRLRRLEWSTRYRPVHIGTLLLGAIAPNDDAEFLYAEGGEFAGEASRVLDAVGISRAGKEAEATLAEFQRSGVFLTHVLECPLEHAAAESAAVQGFLDEQLPSVMGRIRRSLRPKKLVPISRLLEPVLARLTSSNLGCTIMLDLDESRPFALDGAIADEVVARLRQALTSGGVPAR